MWSLKLFLIPISVGLIIFLGYCYLMRHFSYWKKRNVPFIKPKFPYGNFEEVVSLKQSIGDFVANIYRQTNERFVGIWIFATPHLVVKCPELIKTILVKDFNTFCDRTVVSNESVDPVCSQMLFLVKNPRWRAIRNKISMMFTGKKLKNMTRLIDEAGKDMTFYLRERGDRVMNSREIIPKFSTDVIVSCAFGLTAGCFVEEDAPFRLVSKRMCDLTLMNAIRGISYFFIPPMVKIFKICFLDPFCINYLRKAVWAAIEHRESTGTVKNDMIDTLMELRHKDVYGDGTPFDGDHLIAQPVQLFLGGFETTSTTISFALYELALNHQIQDRVRMELHQVYNQYGTFNYESVKHMPYLDKVISETLRKYPVLPYLDRRCTMNYKIPGTDIIIQKGTPIYISLLGLHYDPKYFPNPHKFDPERFNGDALASSKNYYYMPFGNGPRNCVGARFGLLSTKIGLANLISNFKVDKCARTPTTIKFDPNFFLLAPRGGLYLRFIPLQGFIN